MADLTADHIVRHLDLAGYVIMKKPPALGGATIPGEAGFPDAKPERPLQLSATSESSQSLGRRSQAASFDCRRLRPRLSATAFESASGRSKPIRRPGAPIWTAKSHSASAEARVARLVPHAGEHRRSADMVAKGSGKAAAGDC
jgi:hypothetical protein